MLFTWENTGEGLNPLSRDLGSPHPLWMAQTFVLQLLHLGYDTRLLGMGRGIPIPTNAAPNNGFDERDKGRGQRVSGKKGSL